MAWYIIFIIKGFWRVGTLAKIHYEHWRLVFSCRVGVLRVLQERLILLATHKTRDEAVTSLKEQVPVRVSYTLCTFWLTGNWAPLCYQTESHFPETWYRYSIHIPQERNYHFIVCKIIQNKSNKYILLNISLSKLIFFH